MNICLDTMLLEEIASGNQKQKDWFTNILKDIGSHIFLPTVVVTEFMSESLKKRNIDETIMNINGLLKIPRINIIGLKTRIAIEAGKLQHRYRFGIGDCIVIATALHCNCKYIRTDQKEFEKVKGIKTFF